MKESLVFITSAKSNFIVTRTCFLPDAFGLYGQVTKRARWMPRQSEAMKDVVTCDKVRGAGKQALILTFLNGETHSINRVSLS